MTDGGEVLLPMALLDYFQQIMWKLSLERNDSILILFYKILVLWNNWLLAFWKIGRPYCMMSTLQLPEVINVYFLPVIHIILQTGNENTQSYQVVLLI